jgi:hypothetical protein
MMNGDAESPEDSSSSSGAPGGMGFDAAVQVTNEPAVDVVWWFVQRLDGLDDGNPIVLTLGRLRGWKPDLLTAMSDVPHGGTATVIVPSALGRLRQGRLGPSRRQVARAVGTAGWRVVRKTVLWPASGQPRVVVGDRLSAESRWLRRWNILGSPSRVGLSTGRLSRILGWPSFLLRSRSAVVAVRR